MIGRARSAKTVSWGLCLIFASLPLARFITALFGGGNEPGVARAHFGDPLTARIVVTVAIAAVLAYALYTAYHALRAARHHAWLFVGFLLLPMWLEGALVLTLMNYLLLQQGLLNQTWALGARGLVLVVLLTAVVACVLLSPYLATLVRDLPRRTRRDHDPHWNAPILPPSS